MDRFDCGLTELKFLAADGNVEQMTFSGYGAVFGNIDSHGDIIQPGAFKDALLEMRAANQMPAMLLEHGLGMTVQDALPVGVWTEMHEDAKGLFVEGRLAPTPRGQEVYTLMKMGAMSGLSIAYKVVRSSPGQKAGARRILEAVKLREVSPVTFPSNDRSRVDSVKAELTKRTAERALRDAGFSQSEAKRIVSAGFTTGASQRDVGGLDEVAALLRRNITHLR